MYLTIKCLTKLHMHRYVVCRSDANTLKFVEYAG